MEFAPRQCPRRIFACLLPCPAIAAKTNMNFGVPMAKLSQKEGGNMRKIYWSLIWVVVLGCFGPGFAFAGGMWIYEMGTPDMGTASAGRAALANDASTAFSNPAGMTRLDRSQLLGGIEGIIPSVHFDVRQRTNVAGGGGGNAGVELPGGSGFYVHRLSDDCRLGIAVNSYAGGLLDYGNGWSGRYYVEKTDIFTMNVNPVAAYRINECLSVGAGLDVMYGYMKTKVAINNALDSAILGGFPDGQLSVGADTLGVGGNAGVLWEPVKGTRIGVTYRSPVDLGFEDVPEIQGLGPILSAIVNAAGLANKELDLSVTIPQEVMLSAYQDITDCLALVANFGWQDWSQFARVDVGFSTPTGKTFTSQLEFEDTYHFAIGARYRIKPPWTLMAGFAYDTSAMDESSRTPSTPLDRQFRYALGVQYDCSDRLSIGAAYEFMDAGEASVNRTRGPLSGTLAGDYSSNYYNFVATYLSYKF